MHNPFLLRRAAQVLLAVLAAFVLTCSPHSTLAAPAEPTLPAPATPQVTLLTATAQQVTLRVRFPAVQTTLSGAYTTLHVTGLGHAAQLGLPDLPVLHQDVEIPAGATVQVEVLSSAWHTLSLTAPVEPLQAPRPKCDCPYAATPPDAAVYQQNAEFPANPAVLSGEYTQRGHQAVTLEVWAAAYNPISGSLRVAEEMVIRLSFTSGDPARSAELAARYASPAFEANLAQRLLNFNLGRLQTRFASLSAGVGYFIIAPDAYATALAPLVTLKQNQGFNTTLALFSQTGTTKEQIKAYILNAYLNNTPPPSYVLLVGDANNAAESMPGWDSVNASQITDLYYATMDSGDDWVPDIARGRLPARSVQQVTDMVNKLLTYHAFNGTEPWIKKVAFLGTCDSGFYQVAEGTHNYVIDTYTNSAGYTGIFPVNPQPGGDKLYCITNSADTSDVMTSINNARSMVIYSGHGSQTSWAGPGISQSDVRNITATGVLPYVAGFACVTGDYAQTESFAETWVLQPYKGALAYLGSSDNSYWDEDDVLERKMFDSLFDPNPGQSSIGGMMYAGLSGVQAAFPASSRYYWEEYNLMGDPSLEVILGPRQPDFELTATPTQVNLCTNSAANTQITADTILGFADPIDLTLSGMPAGVTPAFDPTPFIPPAASTLTLTSSSAAAGQYNLTLHGTSGALNHTTPLTLNVAAAIPAAPALLTPADRAYNEGPRPLFQWAAVARALTYDLDVASDAAFSDIILSVSGLTGTSYTPTADLDSGHQYFWRVRAGNGCGSSTPSVTWQFATRPQPGYCPFNATPNPIYANTFEVDAAGWTHGGTNDTWTLSALRSHSGAQALHADDPATSSDQGLVTPVFALPLGVEYPITLSFWNYQALDRRSNGCYDGALAEISTNDGLTWQPISADKLLTDPYDANVVSAAPLLGRPAWCGNPHDWVNSIVDLTSFAGQNVRMRFRLASDSAIGSEGWTIDDVSVKSCVHPPQYAVEATPPSAQRLGKPGITTVHIVTVKNNGNLTDSYTVNVSGNTWATSADPTGPLAPGESVDIPVSVNVPADAAPGDADTVLVTFTSTVDPAAPPATAQVNLTTRVQLFNLNLTASVLTESGRPGATINYRFRVTNLGNGPDTFEFAFASPHSWVWTPIAPITLNAGASRDMTLRIVIPAGTPAGTVDVAQFSVTSQIDSAATANLSFTTTATQVYAVTLDLVQSLVTGHPGAPTPFRLTIRNNGNGVDTFLLHVVSDQGWEVVVPAPHSLAAGAEWDAVVDITPPLTAIQGALDNLTFTVTSQNDPAFLPATAARVGSVSVVYYYSYLPISLLP